MKLTVSLRESNPQAPVNPSEFYRVEFVVHEVHKDFVVVGVGSKGDPSSSPVGPVLVERLFLVFRVVVGDGDTVVVEDGVVGGHVGVCDDDSGRDCTAVITSIGVSSCNP